MKPVFKCLADSISLELFRLLLDQGYAHDRKRSWRHKRLDSLILLKMLVLQRLLASVMRKFNSRLMISALLRGLSDLA